MWSAGEQAARLLTWTSRAFRNDLHGGSDLKAVLDALLAGSTDDESLAPDAWARNHPEPIGVYRQKQRLPGRGCLPEPGIATAQRRRPPVSVSWRRLSACEDKYRDEARGGMGSCRDTTFSV